MGTILKKIVMIGLVGGILYMLFGYHFIIVDNSMKLLKKSTIGLKYTVFSTKGKDVESILAIDDLYYDGIGDVLVEAGLMSEDELVAYEAKQE